MKKLLTDCKKSNRTNFEISLPYIGDITTQTSLTNKTLCAPSIFCLNFTSNTAVLNQMLVGYIPDTTIGFIRGIDQLKSMKYEKNQELKLLPFDSKGFLLKTDLLILKRAKKTSAFHLFVNYKNTFQRNQLSTKMQKLKKNVFKQYFLTVHRTNFFIEKLRINFV